MIISEWQVLEFDVFKSRSNGEILKNWTRLNIVHPMNIWHLATLLSAAQCTKLWKKFREWAISFSHRTGDCLYARTHLSTGTFSHHEALLLKKIYSNVLKTFFSSRMYSKCKMLNNINNRSQDAFPFVEVVKEVNICNYW